MKIINNTTEKLADDLRVTIKKTQQGLYGRCLFFCLCI